MSILGQRHDLKKTNQASSSMAYSKKKRPDNSVELPALWAHNLASQDRWRELPGSV